MRLRQHGNTFGEVVRPVELSKDWPLNERAADLCGPVVVDVFEEHRASDDLVSVLIDSAVRYAEVKGYPAEYVEALRSSAWRSAHRFVAKNVDTVDRGAELDDLVKLLGVRVEKA